MMQALKLGEFTRLASTAKQLSLLAQETKEGKYSIVAIDNTGEQAKAYYVRHHRNHEQRTWRLDRLVALLKENGLLKFEVRSLCA